MKAGVTDIFKSFFDSEKAGGLLLIICTIVSLITANNSMGEAYLQLIHYPLPIGPASMGLQFTFEHWVNDGLMAIFFLMVGLEVEREVYVGELSDIRKALLPVMAAIGGMVVPLLIHYAFNAGTDTQPGFAIPMATDIAFALGVLALAGNRVPPAARAFLAALAIIDDIGAIIVIALFYTKTIAAMWLLGAAGIFMLLLVLNKLGVRQLLFYLVPGVVMWYCFYRSGVHATISGVLLALAIPFDKDDARNVSLRLQQALHYPVAFIVVPVFALVNTAIVIPVDGVAAMISNNAVGIMAGLFVGKFAGILLVPALMVRLWKARLPEGLGWGHMASIAMLGGIGFTMSMFIANLAFDEQGVITTSRLAVLSASVCAAIAGLVVLRISGRGRANTSAR
jgi:NhaA family Na+:H+ antiporter